MKPALCFADLAVPLYLLFVSPGVTEGCEHETFISLRPTLWVACGLYFVLNSKQNFVTCHQMFSIITAATLHIHFVYTVQYVF